MAIAKQVKPGMNVIRRLDDDQMGRLVKALEAATVEDVSSPNRLARIIRAAEVVEGDGPYDVAITLGPLHFTLFSSIKSVDEYSQEVARDAVDRDDLPRAEVDKFARRLRTLLSIDPVFSAFRAIALAQAHQNIFLSAEVIVNVRPIFRDGTPKSAVLTYTLAIDYHSHEGRELHLALDESDLRVLRVTLEKAEEKAAKMQEWLKTTSVSTIKV